MASLTIELDDALLARARELAAARKMTVAEMLERLLRVMVASPVRAEDLSPATRRTHGLLPRTTDEQDRATLEDERARRHDAA